MEEAKFRLFIKGENLGFNLKCNKALKWLFFLL